MPACMARGVVLSLAGAPTRAWAQSVSDPPAQEHARPTSLIATARRSTKAQARLLAEAALAVGDAATLRAVRRRLEHDATHLATPSAPRGWW